MPSADSHADPITLQRDGILVIGEALIDIVAHAERAYPEEHVGGSPVNVALALGPHTSTARATIGSDGAATYDFDITWALEVAPEPIPETVVHVGSIAAFLLPGADAVDSTVDGLAGQAIVRPAISDDRLNAITQVESVAERSDIVKMSDEDAAWLYPGWLLEAVADRLLGCGVRIVAITAGPTGALLASPCACVHVPAPTVKVRDTVGAGDTFSAGLIQAALRDNSLLDSLDEEAWCRIGGLAAAAAAITVQRPGADPPTRGELARATRAAAVTECTNASIGVFAY